MLDNYIYTRTLTREVRELRNCKKISIIPIVCINIEQYEYNDHIPCYNKFRFVANIKLSDLVADVVEMR